MKGIQVQGIRLAPSSQERFMSHLRIPQCHQLASAVGYQPIGFSNVCNIAVSVTASRNVDRLALRQLSLAVAHECMLLVRSRLEAGNAIALPFCSGLAALKAVINLAAAEVVSRWLTTLSLSVHATTRCTRRSSTRPSSLCLRLCHRM